MGVEFTAMSPREVPLPCAFDFIKSIPQGSGRLVEGGVVFLPVQAHKAHKAIGITT